MNSQKQSIANTAGQAHLKVKRSIALYLAHCHPEDLDHE